MAKRQAKTVYYLINKDNKFNFYKSCNPHDFPLLTEEEGKSCGTLHFSNLIFYYYFLLFFLLSTASTASVTTGLSWKRFV